TWLAGRVPQPVGRAAVLALLLFPFAFFLVGAVYADALFLAAAIRAFVAAERGRPWVAAALGATAAAARPVGIAVIIGLVVLSLERTRGTPRRSHVLVPLTASLGLVAYCTYLAFRFGNALAFATSEGHWHQSPGLTTLLKIPLFEELFRWG